MTARTNDLLAHAQGLAEGASNLATQVSDAIGTAVGDAASAVADTASHVFESITTTIEHAAGRAPRKRRTKPPLRHRNTGRYDAIGPSSGTA